MRFVHYKDARGMWRWRLIASNNRVIADSGEGYKTELNVLRAIDRISDQAATIAGAERPVKGEAIAPPKQRGAAKLLLLT